jgi:hypothetical protein
MFVLDNLQYMAPSPKEHVDNDRRGIEQLQAVPFRDEVILEFWIRMNGKVGDGSFGKPDLMYGLCPLP